MPDWPHAPLHRIGDPGAYIVTGATYQKAHYFSAPERRDLLLHKLLAIAKKFDWELQSWSVFSNHYHFIAASPRESADSLRVLVQRLHSETARAVNALDQTPERTVWFNYWDTHLTFQRSYLARLKYVHFNPAKHRLVRHPEEYRWCSAAWFRENASRSLYASVLRFGIDRINAIDDFEPV